MRDRANASMPEELQSNDLRSVSSARSAMSIETWNRQNNQAPQERHARDDPNQGKQPTSAHALLPHRACGLL